MKRFALLLTLLALMAACTHRSEPGWKLVWEEEFDGESLDPAIWSRIPRGTADWNNYHSSDDRCFALRDGRLVLRGIVNDDRAADTAAYLTGGVETRGKHAFDGGRIEIRAKLQGARGAWPAFWLMPFDEEHEGWPHCGEIDIMERLNFDTFAYQTTHSYYSSEFGGGLGIKNDPPHGGTGPIDPDAFNVYGVDFWPDSLVFRINGRRTFAYPRIETDREGQFPFCRPWFLMLDMQLGGSWVGKVDPADLPVEMEIDWVRHYQWE